MVRSWSSTLRVPHELPLVHQQHRHVVRAEGRPPGGLVGEPPRLDGDTQLLAGRREGAPGAATSSAPTSPTVRVGSTPPPYISGTTMMATTISDGDERGDPERGRAHALVPLATSHQSHAPPAAAHAPSPSDTASRNRSVSDGGSKLNAVTSPARRASARISSRSHRRRPAPASGRPACS